MPEGLKGISHPKTFLQAVRRANTIWRKFVCPFRLLGMILTFVGLGGIGAMIATYLGYVASKNVLWAGAGAVAGYVIGLLLMWVSDRHSFAVMNYMDMQLTAGRDRGGREEAD